MLLHLLLQHKIIIYANDSSGNVNSNTLNFAYDSTAPNITINLPIATGGYNYEGLEEEINWSVSDNNFDSVWYNYNGTNITLHGAINSSTFTLGTSPFNLTIWSNDSIGNVGSTYINWSYTLFQNEESYVTPTTVGVTNLFSLNLTTDGSIVTISYLNYNGTNSLGSISSIGNTYILSRNQIAPSVSESTNIPFYWNITLNDGTNLASVIHNQTINPVIINETCSGSMYTVYNFTMVDELTQALISASPKNTSIKVDLELYSSDRTLKILDFSKEFIRINPVAICINNNLSNGEIYSLDIQVEYKGDDYSTEFYNIERAVLKESTIAQNITLYDLPTANTQEFELLVRDTSYLPIDGALIKIERKYLENGTFYVTEIPKANEGGISAASLQVNDVIYNFYIYDAGVLISTFTNVLAICQTPLVSPCEIDFNAFQSTITIPNYEDGDDFNFTLSYDDTSKLVSSQFVIPSGEPSIIKLVITSEDALGTSVCSDTLTSSSGTLSCVVPSSFGNSTVMAKLYKDDVEQGKGNIKLDQKSGDIFPGILVLLSVLVMVTLIGVGVSDNPVVTGVFIFVGVVLLFGMNLVQNTGFIGATASILFLAIAIIIVIIKAAKRS